MKAAGFLSMVVCLSVVSASSGGPVNLIYNGDFEAGNVGFYSAYSDHTNDPAFNRLDGGSRYIVRHTPQEGHPHWPAYGDHTTGSGLQFIANGATDQRVAWKQTDIPVAPGRDYTFSYALSSWNTTSPARMETRINGQVLGTASGPTSVPSWQEPSYTWNSGTSTKATIELRDLDTGWVGNDFMLDDISLSFSPLSTQKVFLRFDAEEIPVRVYAIDTPWTDPFYRAGPGSMDTIWDVSGLAVWSAAVEQAVKSIFTASGISNIDFVDDPVGATTVWFAKKPDDPSWDLGGVALPGNLEWWHSMDGIDLMNRNEADSVVVFVSPWRVETGPPAATAADIAHELGHTLGLVHIQPPLGPDENIVMDYRPNATLPKFYNGVATWTEPPDGTGIGLGFTQNPTYHLLRYTMGLSESELSLLGVQPGSLDRPGVASLFQEALGNLDFGLNLTLYNVQLFDVAIGSGFEDSLAVLIGSFDQIVVSELGEYAFPIRMQTGVMMYGASTPGGDWDVALAMGDPFAPGATCIIPTYGTQNVYLQMWTDQNPSGYITLAQGTFTARAVSQAIPAPGAVLLGGVGAGLVGSLRRRRVS